jgi:large subunit ribosomal protein L23
MNGLFRQLGPRLGEKAMSKTLVLKPRLSEKTYAMSESLNVYTFEIPTDATKHTVAAAIKAQYDVVPANVRCAAVHGKNQRSYRKGARGVRYGKRSDIRKAYVTLKEGDKLPIYAAVEEANSAMKESK